MTTPMTSKKTNPDPNELKYPCYVSPLPTGARFTHIPGISEIKALEGIKYSVIEGFEGPNDTVLLFDCLDVKDWFARKSKKTLEERLRDLRATTLFIARFFEILDLPVDLVSSSSELITLYKQYLAEGHKGIIIRDVDGKYCFGESQDGEYMELIPNKESL